MGLAAALWVAPSRPAWLLGMCGIAAASDVADGWVARLGRMRRAKRGGPAWLPADDVGAWLDPLCDKVFVVSLVVAVWLALGASPLRLALIATREMLLAPLILAWFAFHPAGRRLDFRARPVGKATTVAQFLALGAVVLDNPAQLALAVVAAALGALAVARYVAVALRTTLPRTPCPSISKPTRHRWWTTS